MEDEQQMVPLKLLDPKNCDIYVWVHRDLVALANTVKGMHHDSILWELALMWRNYMRHGEFLVSTKVLNHIYHTQFRAKLIGLLETVSEVTKTYSIRSKCKTRQFTIDGVVKKSATYKGSTWRPAYSLMPGMGMTVKVPASWLTSRYEKWCDYCKERDLPQHLDLDGRTEWGGAILSTLAKTALPASLPEDTKPETVQRHKALTETGVPAIVTIRHGRAYHPLISLSKTIRRQATLDGRQSVECDYHAAYTCSLASELPDSPGKQATIEELQSGKWYAQFEPAYERWMEILEHEGTTYRNEQGKWMMRVDDNPDNDEEASVKVEYQRQCLFWKDNRPRRNPLRQVLRERHPELCKLIELYRDKLSPSEFSHVLTRAEGSLMVQDVVPTLARRGIPVLSIHDGAIVPEDCADDTREVMEMIAYEHFGFVPHVAVKSAPPLSVLSK